MITVCLILLIFTVDQIRGYGSDGLCEKCGETVGIYGTIDKITKEDEEYFKLVLEDVSFSDGTPYKKKVLVQIYEEVEGYLYLDGAFVAAEGEVSIPQERRNPGCFDYRRYLKSMKIRAVIRDGTVTVLKEPEGLRRMMGKLRGSVVESLSRSPGGDAGGILIGMLFGDKDYISDETMDMFRKGGTAHILAVSGLHIGIIYGFLLKFRRRKRSLPGDIAIASFMIFYAALCWFTASVMRAVLMIFIHMAGNHLNRRYDFTCGICASMILSLLMNPYQIYSAGFQMSYLAAFIIAFVMPIMRKRMDGMMLTIVTMQLGMAPYIAFTFNYVSVAGFLCNIPVSFAAAFLIPAGVCLLPLCALGIDGPFAELLGLPAGLMIRCNEITYAGGALCFDCVSPPLWSVVFFYSILFYFCSEEGRIRRLRRDRKKILRMVSAFLVLAIAFSAAMDDGFSGCEYTFVDVGQGDCLHIREGGMDVLIDGGGAFGYDVGNGTLKPYLLKNGVGHVDIAIATHLHMDHFQGLCELSQTYRIDTLAIYEGNREEEKEIREKCRVKNILYLKYGDEIRMGKEGSIRVIGPEAGSRGAEEDENANSLVLRCEIQGVSVLMTGDIDEEGERNLLRISQKSDIRCSVLKAAHHGSHYSSCDHFLEAAAPELTVISVGKNNYGHPAQETLDRLDENGIPYYRTDESGAVGIDVDKEKIRTMK